jgi:hypothetical protein
LQAHVCFVPGSRGSHVLVLTELVDPRRYIRSPFFSNVASHILLDILRKQLLPMPSNRFVYPRLIWEVTTKKSLSLLRAAQPDPIAEALVFTTSYIHYHCPSPSAHESLPRVRAGPSIRTTFCLTLLNRANGRLLT